MRRLIEDGVKTGEFVAADAALVTRAMLGALNWTITWFRPDGPQSADVVGADHVGVPGARHHGGTDGREWPDTQERSMPVESRVRVSFSVNGEAVDLVIDGLARRCSRSCARTCS